MEVKFIDGDVDKGGRFIWKPLVMPQDIILKDLIAQLESVSARQVRIYTEGKLYSLASSINPDKT